MDNLHILTDEQLVKMAQEGSETAEEILIEKYKNLAKAKSKIYYITGADSEDVVQEGMIGLFKAIRGFDIEREVKFKTFAEKCVDSQIITAIKTANRKKHQPLNESLSLNSELDDDGETNGNTLSNILVSSTTDEPENKMLFKEIGEYLKNSESGLFSELEWKVLNEKLKGYTYIEIAEKMDKTPKSIDNALNRIKKKVVAYLSE